MDFKELLTKILSEVKKDEITILLNLMKIMKF